MAGAHKRTPGFTLGRWSQRKLASKHGDHTVDAPTPIAVDEPAETLPASLGPPAVAESKAAPPAAVPLPDIEGMSFESDFSVFFQPKVDETLKRQALKKLFSDPRFNAMDGLDTYIADYSLPDPISAEVARGLVQARNIFRVDDEDSAAETMVDNAATAGSRDEPQAAPISSAPATVLPPPQDSAPDAKCAVQSDEGHDAETGTKLPTSVPSLRNNS